MSSDCMSAELLLFLTMISQPRYMITITKGNKLIMLLATITALFHLSLFMARMAPTIVPATPNNMNRNEMRTRMTSINLANYEES
jgi:hypothetical protein